MFEDFFVHKNDEYYALDYRGYIFSKFCIARKYKPKKIIEIGVRTGYSAYAFLSACPEAEYYGFDAENGAHGGEGGPYMDHAKKLLNKFPNVNFQIIDTQRTNTLGDFKADFIHVDGDHSLTGVIHDIDMVYNHHLEEGGVIVVDDFDRIDSVKQGVRSFLKNNSNINYKAIESFNGDAILGNVKDVFDD